MSTTTGSASAPWQQLLEQTAPLEAALQQSFRPVLQLRPQEPQAWSDQVSARLRVPGWVAWCATDSGLFAWLVPQSAERPAWYHATTDSSPAPGLQAVVERWRSLLHGSWRDPSQETLQAVADLQAVVEAQHPTAETMLLEWWVMEEAAHRGACYVVGPLRGAAHCSSEGQPFLTEPHTVASSSFPSSRGEDTRLARLRAIPVTVSVRLAEKRIPVAQLLHVTPGALLTFDKSCDDLLEMYVNNVHYGRGEAVKVGEYFGIKINQIGPPPPRPSKIVPG